MEEQTVIQAEQTSAKVVTVRGGKAPKTEVRVSSLCMKGDEAEMVDLLIKTQVDIHKKLMSESLVEGSNE